MDYDLLYCLNFLSFQNPSLIMGAQNSNLRKCIEKEYSRLLKAGSDELVLEEMLNFRLPQSNWTVDARHLGVLFVADGYGRGKLNSCIMFMGTFSYMCPL